MAVLRRAVAVAVAVAASVGGAAAAAASAVVVSVGAAAKPRGSATCRPVRFVRRTPSVYENSAQRRGASFNP